MTHVCVWPVLYVLPLAWSRLRTEKHGSKKIIVWLANRSSPTPPAWYCVTNRSASPSWNLRRAAVLASAAERPSNVTTVRPASLPISATRSMLAWKAQNTTTLSSVPDSSVLRASSLDVFRASVGWSSRLREPEHTWRSLM